MVPAFNSWNLQQQLSFECSSTRQDGARVRGTPGFSKPLRSVFPGVRPFKLQACYSKLSSSRQTKTHSLGWMSMCNLHIIGSENCKKESFYWGCAGISGAYCGRRCRHSQWSITYSRQGNVSHRGSYSECRFTANQHHHPRDGSNWVLADSPCRRFHYFYRTHFARLSALLSFCRHRGSMAAIWIVYILEALPTLRKHGSFISRSRG